MSGFLKQFLVKFTPDKKETLVKLMVLSSSMVLAFGIRLFSVLRYESMIHEFDPYFNYRTTKFLSEEGFYSFHNWFDDRAWYPLGRIIGGTIYPGLMVTSAAIFHVLQFFNLTVDVREVCVFLAPLFSSFTVLVTYKLTSELWSTGAGLVSAAMIAIVPGYISRSVAGSYDNEGIAIFCMLFTYYLWIKSVKTGQISWAVMCALAYFYMVSSWGGYVFLINLIPLHVFVLIICGRFSHRVYVAYSTVYALGTVLSMQISFVGFQPVQTSEHMMGVMVRLMLVLAPVMCILSGIAVSASLTTYMKYLDSSGSGSAHGKGDKKSTKGSKTYYQSDSKGGSENKELIATAFVTLISFFLVTYAFHCVWATSEAYSSPSIVLSARSHDGSRIIFDDFREAYWWLRMNTPEDAKVMSWWDYGYQITAMANRTILVDNNTWNNTHISRVGQAMASDEEHAYEIMKELDVDYVLVIFGGLIGYSSDDINKFLWMVRIGGSTDKGEHIKESDYYTPSGEFRVDSQGSSTLLNCLMYKLCYYRFGQVYTEGGKPTGYDRVRNAEIGNKDFELDVLEEAYTTEHWIARIYKVKDRPNRGA